MTAPTAALLEERVAIGALALQNGVVLEDVVQHVARYGADAAPDGSNVVLVPHALTGSSHVPSWWGGIAGPGALLDTDRLCVVGINALGSCYGSTGPASIAPDGAPYGVRFPVVAVDDMVRAQRAALKAIGIEKIALVIGGSLGGMQALAWAHEAPNDVEHAVVIAAYDHVSAMGIALNTVARQALRNAPTPEAGIALARMIGMITYKSDALFTRRFERRVDRGGGDPLRNLDDRFDVEGYLDYQGRIFADRMDPQTYEILLRAMDLFDVRSRPIELPFPRLTFVGIAGDWLFPAAHIWETSDRFAGSDVRSTYVEMPSDHGHDAFLAEQSSLTTLLAPHLRTLLG